MTFQQIINKIENDDHKIKYVVLLEWLEWIEEKYPEFDKAVKWSNPCYEKEGTFIIGVTPYKGHIAVNIEKAGIDHFEKELEKSPYSSTEMTFRVAWNQEMDYNLLEDMINFQLEDKKGLKTYWRK